VTGVSVNGSGTGTVTYMEQNASANGWGSVSATNKVLGDNISGWLHDPNGGSTSTTPNVGIRIGSELYEKRALGDGWSDEGSGSNGYWKVAGDRFAKWDGNSGLWVKDGPAGSWYNVSGTDTAEWSISSNLVAVRIGSTLYAKAALGDGWSNEGSASNGYWKIAGNRLAKWDGNSGLWVKDGPAGSWYNVVGTSAQEWSISSNLVAYRNGSNLYAKTGLGDGWTTVSTSVSAGYWKIAGSRIARWDGNAGLYVRDGIGTTWTLVSDTSTAEWSISSDMVAVRIGSELYAKAALDVGWSDEGSATNGYWKISGSRLVKWDGNSGLWAKDGPAGSWYLVAGTDTAEWNLG
jgi:hypothetical protein